MIQKSDKVLVPVCQRHEDKGIEAQLRTAKVMRILKDGIIQVSMDSCPYLRFSYPAYRLKRVGKYENDTIKRN